MGFCGDEEEEGKGHTLISAIRMRLAVLLAVLPLAACVPFPHFEYYAPPVHGIVLQNGNPVLGASIQVTARFTDHVANTETDGAGKFETPYLREVGMVIYAVGDRIYSYQVSINVNGTQYLGFIDAGMGEPDTGVALYCDLAVPVARYKTSVYCTEKN